MVNSWNLNRASSLGACSCKLVGVYRVTPAQTKEERKAEQERIRQEAIAKRKEEEQRRKD